MDMMSICGSFCDLIPSSWHWVMAIVMPLLFIVIVGVPVANVLYRAGRSRWREMLSATTGGYNVRFGSIVLKKSSETRSRLMRVARGRRTDRQHNNAQGRPACPTRTQNVIR